MDVAEHTRELAHSFMHGAVDLYERDGHLAPVVIFINAEGHGLIIVPHPQLAEHPGDAAAHLTLMLGRPMETEFVAFIAETWVKQYHVPDGTDAPLLQRGDLSRMSETDPEVQTSLMVMVFAVKEWEHSHSLHLTLSAFEHDGVMGLGLEPSEHPGFPEGHVPDAIRAAYSNSPPMECPPLDAMARILEEHNVASSVVLL
jgi:hypothetical protein